MDGFLEYQTRSPRGLDNQYWKDSPNSILFADGTMSDLLRATCEIQGYAYDAKRRAARLAREAWNDKGLSDRLDEEAATLRRRFREAFWIEERGHLALALDGSKRQVDSLTSNIGHLLWSGILDSDHGSATRTLLMSEELYTGWGVRTMSTRDCGYNPIEYRNGTVWPTPSCPKPAADSGCATSKSAARASRPSHSSIMFVDADIRLPGIAAPQWRVPSPSPLGCSGLKGSIMKKRRRYP